MCTAKRQEPTGSVRRTDQATTIAASALAGTETLSHRAELQLPASFVSVFLLSRSGLCDTGTIKGPETKETLLFFCRAPDPPPGPST
jgi:hypothetical protein